MKNLLLLFVLLAILSAQFAFMIMSPLIWMAKVAFWFFLILIGAVMAYGFFCGKDE